MQNLYMKVDSDSNSVSEAGKSISVPVFPKKVFTTELGDADADGKPESLFPTCFMQLPTELKLKILDSVSGVDIAKASCVCSELRNLASSDDVWEQKYVAQFGNCNGLGSEGSFKERFVKAWEGRKSGSGGLCFNNIMRKNRFNPFGCELRDDDVDWLEIVRLLPRVGVNSSTQERNADVTL